MFSATTSATHEQKVLALAANKTPLQVCDLTERNLPTVLLTPPRAASIRAAPAERA